MTPDHYGNYGDQRSATACLDAIAESCGRRWFTRSWWGSSGRIVSVF